MTKSAVVWSQRPEQRSEQGNVFSSTFPLEVQDQEGVGWLRPQAEKTKPFFACSFLISALLSFLLSFFHLSSSEQLLSRF